MNIELNQQKLKTLKSYLNKEYKLLNFDYKGSGDIFNNALDDRLIIKIFCHMKKCDECNRCPQCKECKDNQCNCQHLISFMKAFAKKYDCYMETNKFNVNNIFTYHQFEMYINNN